MNTIGQLCRAYRIENGLTIAELAERLNVSMQTIYCYEHGRSKCPKASLKKRMEELFNVEIIVRRQITVQIS